MSCNPKCVFAGYYNLQGDRVMIAQPGNPKKKAGEKHPECMACVRPGIMAQVREMAAEELANLHKTGEYEHLTPRQRMDLGERLSRGLDGP